MKTFNFIIVVVFGFTIAMLCSRCDEGANLIVERTFLEKYEETVWHISISKNNSEYVMFDNNESFPFKQWMLIYGFGCYDTYNYNMSTFKATITQNIEDNLEISFANGDTWLITVKGNELYWAVIDDEGIVDYVFNRQDSEVVEELALCFP